MKFNFLSKNKIARLPRGPGVYVLKNKESFYMGKAANIKERVKNHFLRPSFREGIFLSKTKKIGFIKTDSEIEALILEANLIKKRQPKYNVLWRDNKNYFFVGMTKEDFPRIFITHQPVKVVSSKYKVSGRKRKNILNTKYKILNTKFVGPFVDGKALKKTLKFLRKVFPYRTCKTLPKPRTRAKLGTGLVQNRSKSSGSGRACLWYQLDRCPGPCLLQSKASQQIPLTRIKRESQKNSKNIFMILQGRKNRVLKNLKKEMKEAVEVRDFEGAAKIRDKIFALEKTLYNAKIFRIKEGKMKYSDIEKKLKKLLKRKRRIKRIEAYDVSNISGKLATGAMVVFLEGEPAKRYYRKFRIKISGKPNDVGMLKECLVRRFKHPEWNKPDLILIDGGRTQLNAALDCLRSRVKHGKDIEVIAIAKRKNELYIKGRKPILLKKLSREVFNLILQLRDEAHRFAFFYHRRLRRKKLLE